MKQRILGIAFIIVALIGYCVLLANATPTPTPKVWQPYCMGIVDNKDGSMSMVTWAPRKDGKCYAADMPKGEK